MLQAVDSEPLLSIATKVCGDVGFEQRDGAAVGSGSGTAFLTGRPGNGW
jgi:hypothetical protein